MMHVLLTKLVFKAFGVYIKALLLMLLLSMGWVALPALGLYQCIGIVMAYELLTFRVQFVRPTSDGGD
jgi:hypothetical protein